ncbi:unnamed protein product [Malus baccata var. baccata]
MEKSYPSLSSLSRRLLLKQSREAKALPTTEEQEILTTTTTPTRLPNCWGTTPEQDYYNLQGIKSSKSVYTSPRGRKLLTRQWLPLRRPRLYATPIFLAQNGFACIALDLGARRLRRPPRLCPRRWPCGQRLRIVLQFGQTAGPPISWTPLFFIRSVHGRGRFASSCTSPPRRPQKKLAVVPTADLIWKSVKVEEKKIVADVNPARNRGKPRLAAVVELLRVTQYVSERLVDVSLPFIVLHGSADVGTDPELSRALYAAAKSEDKTLKIYEGMMQSSLFGEIDENVEVVEGRYFGLVESPVRRRREKR